MSALPQQTDKWTSGESIVSGLQIHECRAGNYVRGTVATPQDIALVYSRGLQYVGPTPLERATADKLENVPLKTTSLTIILQGWRKERIIEEAYSERLVAHAPRGARVTLAREFAVEAAREGDRQKAKESADGR